jgi:hypothetical protein
MNANDMGREGGVGAGRGFSKNGLEDKDFEIRCFARWSMGTKSAFRTSFGDDERGASEGINKGDILAVVAIVQSLNGELLAPSSSELLVEAWESHLSPNLNILPILPSPGNEILMSA